MIERYSISEINKIWSDENKIATWWLVELEILKAWEKLKIIPKADIEKIKNDVKISLDRMLILEEETKHDVVAFTRMISESLGRESRWIHLGITSTDIVDTSQNLLIKNSFDIFLEEFTKLKETIKQLALKYKETLIMGRSHGIYGEPTSLGLKFLLWFEELSRQEKRMKDAIKDVCVTKISGSMGNFANLELEIEEEVAKNINMNYDRLSTQVSQRDRHMAMIFSFANYATTIEKISTEIRLLQRSEVKEIFEGFSKNQKGSSSMPHKKNPIGCENLSGLSRLIKSYVIPSMENNVLWHERDISHSSNERIIFPNMFNLVVYVTKRLNGILENIVIDEKRMLDNIHSSNNVFYSQVILTEIIKRTNFSREEIYDFIQKCSLISLEKNKDFIKILIDNSVEKYLDIKELKIICNLNYFLRNVNKLFKRIL